MLLVPRNAMESFAPADWEHVFLHELAHFQRRDHWTQIAQLMALCAHWFNPLVWFGFRYLRADRELAADEWALQKLGGEAAAYGATLLKVLAARTCHPRPSAVVGILEDRRQLKQRLRHVIAFAPPRFPGSCAGLLTAITLGAVVLGQQSENIDLARYQGLAPVEILLTAARAGERPVVEKMLANGVDVNSIVPNAKGEHTPLCAAIAGHQLDLARLLVTRGADVNLKAGKGDSALVLAWKRGWSDEADFLLSKGASAEPDLQPVAEGDGAGLEKVLRNAAPDFEKLKTQCEIAAAYGHAEILAKLCDSIRELPSHTNWVPGDNLVKAAMLGNHKGAIEQLILHDPNLLRGGVARYSGFAAAHPGMREWLNEKGFSVPEYTDGEWLIDATEREDLPEMRRLLDTGTDINFRGESGWTSLTKASAWGCPRAVRLLLEKHADPNTVKSPGWDYTPLCLARTTEIADLLLAAGANLNARLYETNEHIMSYCVAQGPKEMVQWFLDHGVMPETVRRFEPTLLFSAGTAEIAEMLIAHGVEVQARNEQGQTALIWQLMMNPAPARIVATLLRHGADPNEKSEGSVTPLMCAPDAASVDALVAAGADLWARNDRAGVLEGTGHSSDFSRVEALLRHGMKLDAEAGANLLISSIVLRRDLPGVKKLLALGVDPQTGEQWEGRRTGSPLSVAIGNGSFAIAEVLRGAGARDVGLLSEAAARGNLPGMEALLAAGAGVDELSATKMTPLHYAVLRAQAGAVRMLLQHGADVNRFDTAAETPALEADFLLAQMQRQHYSQIRDREPEAVKSALQEIVAAINAARPNLNTRDEAGETVLMCAARVGRLTFPLEGSGADVNAQRPDGMTALMLAIASQPKNARREGPGSTGTFDKSGQVVEHHSARGGVVKELLDGGADLTLRNQAGQTAMDLAEQLGNREVLELLRESK